MINFLISLFILSLLIDGYTYGYLLYYKRQEDGMLSSNFWMSVILGIILCLFFMGDTREYNEELFGVFACFGSAYWLIKTIVAVIMYSCLYEPYMQYKIESKRWGADLAEHTDSILVDYGYNERYEEWYVTLHSVVEGKNLLKTYYEIIKLGGHRYEGKFTSREELLKQVQALLDNKGIVGKYILTDSKFNKVRDSSKNKTLVVNS